MKIEQLPTDSLEIEPGFNVRTEAEIKANAKELAKDMEAHGGFDVSAPITYVQRGKTKLVRAGHTRLAAARLLEIPEVTAIKVEDDYTKSLVNLVTSNAGHPLTRRQQGEVYTRLRDGVKEDEEAMDEKAIADQFHRSAEHIRQCIVIYEAPDEIRPLLDSDEIPDNVYITAKQWSRGDVKKTKRILLAALKVAKADGKDRATKKHLDSVKAEFVELRAKGSKKGKEGKEEKSDLQELEKRGDGGSAEGEDGEMDHGQSMDEGAEHSLDIGGHNAPTWRAAKLAALRPTLAHIIRECSEEYNWAATDYDVDGCVEKILEAL